MKKLLSSVFIFCVVIPAGAQRVLQITEIGETKKYLLTKDTISANSSLVDINSALEIEINKTALKKIIGEKAEQGIPAEMLQTITFLTKVLQEQNRILQEFKRNIQSYDPSNPKAVQKFNRDMQVIGKFVNDLFRQDPVAKAYHDSLGPEIDLMDGFFYAAGMRLRDLQAELVELKSGKKTSLQLGVWRQNKTEITPIHLNGFDALPEQGYYSVARWEIMPTKEQLDQVRQLQSFAKENKETGLELINIFLQKTENQLRENFSKLANDNLADIGSAFEVIKIELQSPALQTKIETLVKNYTNLMNALRSRIDQYRAGFVGKPSSDVLILSAQLSRDSEFLLTGVNNLTANFNAVISEIEALPVAIKNKADALKQLLKNKLSAIAASIIPSTIDGLFEGYKLDVASLDYSEKVFKLAINDVPAVIKLDLGTTGKREEGDKILIKLNVTDEAGKQVIGETKDIVMYSLAVHVQGTVGVIFAHPTTTTAITKKFQMAPYYNLLFKSVWPWTERYHRKSAANNSFWDFSWGLHVSTPDFNKDDVPELGVGIAVSGIKDILQVGFAHNIFENKPYWFFGIRLPVPSMNFGGGSRTNAN